ncbi:sigma-70 family RNA polymerase sigma factor [Planobispora takensis]|uniref:RNA polymerase sigma factor n=1 Tax=Planobispora takensis TaxID=1367882 RepID=A0A8J3WT85_9ACTN|nr:sigma-70 family RNA polymerase sigma factor [Planobispora takensis]GII01554.1 RNA polymerase sigma factor [Planobispora takensis]
MDHATAGALFRAAVAGDAAAWKALVEGLSPLVWSVVRAHRLNEADGIEVYQTAWFRLAQHLRRIREPDKVAAWLASTTRHECLKVLKAARPLPLSDHPQVFDRFSDEPTPEEAVIGSEEAALDRERLHRLWQAFHELGERCQRLLRLLMASPAPNYLEVAAALGLAVGSIGPIRQRCLRQLRVLLAERGVR